MPAAKKKAAKKAARKRAPRKGESPTSPRMVRATVKEIKALRLRLAGMHYQEIADEVGYKSPSGAQQAVERAMRKLPLEDAGKLREKQLRQLAELQRSNWPRALKGSPAAANVIIRCMVREARLHGLDAPRKVKGELEVTATAAAKREAVLALLHGPGEE